MSETFNDTCQPYPVQVVGQSSACVRYTASQGSFNLEVSEWYVFENDLISEIVAYYNIEEQRIDLQNQKS